MKELILRKLDLLGESFTSSLEKSNDGVVKSLKQLGKSDDQIRKIEFFDWFQGVGLYGVLQLYKLTNNKKYLSIICEYYKNRITDGLPEKNINSMAPMLTMICLYEETGNEEYKRICNEWAEWLYDELPRTKEGGFQHVTCEDKNSGELWDDTLFMSVLFMVKAGVIFEKKNYVEEAIYQFMLHAKYLTDTETGLWYHGWTFQENHNFVKALWARGNCWITIFIPEFLDIIENYPIHNSVRRYMIQAFVRQIESILYFQNQNGLWHTLMNERDSYIEASASCGFVYGMLKGYRMGLFDNATVSEQVKEAALLAIKAVLPLVDEKGVLQQVSGGTPMGKESLDFYKKIPIEPMPYGQALAILAFVQAVNVVG